MTARNQDSLQSFKSLQDAVARMIPNPQAVITDQPLAPGILHQSLRNSDRERDEPQRRSEGQGQQQQGRNGTEEQHSSRRNDTPGQQRFESSDAQRRQDSPEGNERIRNELAENDITLVADNDLHTESIENPPHSDALASLPTTNDFMANSFCLPAGSRVRSPQYYTYKERLRTFKNWPSHLTQRPTELALAGFYFLGTADVVRCFACDGGLKNWEPEDDPWIEHARWFSSCDWLRHVKGEEFIRLVRLMDDESEEEDENPSVNDYEQTTRYIECLSLDDCQGKVETSVLDADCAQSVIQTGFSDMAVVRAINDLLKEGRKEYRAQDILMVILDKEEKENMQRQELGCLSTTSRHISTCQNEGGAAVPVLQEYEKLKHQMMCTECGEHERNVLFLPCKHHTVCEKCSPQIYVCFTCFKKIQQKVKTYMS